MMYVEKTDDGSTGWVPGNITRELQSDHMRARNFKQRYQFLKALAELDMAETWTLDKFTMKKWLFVIRTVI